MTNTTKLQAQELSKLRQSRFHLLCARLAALDATLHLVCAQAPVDGRAQDADSRAKRSGELCGLISDAVAHVERLIFFVEGDG